MTHTPTDGLPLRTGALLLDMDGTLIDSGLSVERAWNGLLAELGSTETFGHAMHGRPARQVLREFFPDMTEAEIAAAHSRIEQLEIADVDSILTLPGTRRILEQLDAASQQLGRPTWTIVTSCTMPLFEARWATTSLPVPATLVTADQVERGKPDPQPYLLGAERLGVAPSDAVVVEDSVGGLRSGLDAGCRTMAITSTTPAADLEPLAPVLLTSLDDLEVAVQEGALLLSRRGGQ
ncbi:HAD-IA family hydrolase [Brachybacterium epidermidis]|uniref:HAD-IA family hydrolase n=1 Tax=Brachybacterium epidermidis TaxID=2781983 RepID=UPI00398E389A